MTSAASTTDLGSKTMSGASRVYSIPVTLEIVLGSAKLPISELVLLQRGDTIALNRKVHEPVDICVNGRPIATGDIVVLDDNPNSLGIKLVSVV